MKVSKQTRIGLLALALVFPVLAIALGLFVWEPLWLFHRNELRTGNEIVSRVEAFRVRHGKVPETLQEVGIDDKNLSVFYRKVSGDEYVVWFGAYRSVGESVTYDSRTKKWE